MPIAPLTEAMKALKEIVETANSGLSVFAQYAADGTVSAVVVVGRGEGVGEKLLKATEWIIAEDQ